MVGRSGDEPSRENWARRNGGWVAIAALLVGGWMAVIGPGTMPRTARGLGTPTAGHRAITPCVIAQLGNDAAMAYLHDMDHGRALRAVEAATAAVVRFEVLVGTPEGKASPRQWGSGTLVNGGRHVLVAGHVLDLEGEPDDVTYSVVLPDGRTFPGRVPAVRGGIGGAPEGDWGLVELEDVPPKGCSSLPLGSAADGATVVLLGYPERKGLDAEGTVTEHEVPYRFPLRALAFVGTVNNAESGRIEIVAGSQPRGGMSGGAVIDLQGNVVGVVVSSNLSTMRTTPGPGSDTRELPTFEETIGVRATPIGKMRAFLDERWKR